MIDGGIVLFLLAIIVAAATPTERALTVRKHHKERPMVGPPLRTAFPLAAPRPDIETLKHAAVEAVDTCDLDRGIAGVADVYRRAARQRRKSAGEPR